MCMSIAFMWFTQKNARHNNVECVNLQYAEWRIGIINQQNECNIITSLQ